MEEQKSGAEAGRTSTSDPKVNTAADEAAQRAKAADQQKQTSTAAEQKALADQARAAGGSPSGTVSAKATQPTVTPVDTAKGGQPKVFDVIGPDGTSGEDKLADMPQAAKAVAPAPTQDPPVNVSGRVPVGSSRVDLTKSENTYDAGASLQGQPGGHLGAGGGAPPRPMNPPVRPRGGSTS